LNPSPKPGAVTKHSINEDRSNPLTKLQSVYDESGNEIQNELDETKKNMDRKIQEAKRGYDVLMAYLLFPCFKNALACSGCRENPDDDYDCCLSVIVGLAFHKLCLIMLVQTVAKLAG